MPSFPRNTERAPAAKPTCCRLTDPCGEACVDDWIEWEQAHSPSPTPAPITEPAEREPDYRGAFMLLYTDVEDAVRLGDSPALQRLLAHRVEQFRALWEAGMGEASAPSPAPAPITEGPQPETVRVYRPVARIVEAAPITRETADDIEWELRREWWLGHGHSNALYGDDGEMQCAKCVPMTDYKRDPLDKVREAAQKARLARAAEAFAAAAAPDADLPRIAQETAVDVTHHDSACQTWREDCSCGYAERRYKATEAILAALQQVTTR